MMQPGEEVRVNTYLPRARNTVPPAHMQQFGIWLKRAVVEAGV